MPHKSPSRRGCRAILRGSGKQNAAPILFGIVPRAAFGYS